MRWPSGIGVATAAMLIPSDLMAGPTQGRRRDVGGEHQRVIDGGVGCDGGAELGGDNSGVAEMPVAVADPSVSTACSIPSGRAAATKLTRCAVSRCAWPADAECLARDRVEDGDLAVGSREASFP